LASRENAVEEVPEPPSAGWMVPVPRATPRILVTVKLTVRAVPSGSVTIRNPFW
jgi:hypothetical protein